MSGKIVSVEKMGALRKELASAGKTVVMTNGCFDLLHVGHLRCLKEAREQGDMLIVGLNDDRSTRRVKGRGQPFVPQEDRAELLAALECVDYVVMFSEPTAERLVRALKPDIYVKGGDYLAEELPEAKVVAEYGGKIYLAPLTPGRSTSDLVSAIVAHYRGNGR